ncbi:hypothetical protein SAZ11_00565 [Streptomyces sp. FXJ1.4098]|nr:hypothetical protein [Streptomyces sp. FXJ1.4098]
MPGPPGGSSFSLPVHTAPVAGPGATAPLAPPKAVRLPFAAGSTELSVQAGSAIASAADALARSAWHNWRRAGRSPR